MMLQPLRKGARKAVARSATVPAPVSGWDAISPIASMKPDHATLLDNFFPREGYVELRGGHLEWATTAETDEVETLMAYQGQATSADHLFAAVNGKVFNVTATGAAGAAVVSSLANARLQHVNFTTSGGHFLFFVNGADAPRHYNGTTWATPSITVATPANFAHVAVWKNRLLFAENDKTRFWYLPVDSVAGAAASYELDGVFSQGGYLMAIGTWTIDGGVGIDDYLVLMSSRGQVAIYKGTDPSSAATFALVGVFNLAPPIGRRCMVKVGSDLMLVTLEGVIPLSKSLALDRAALQTASITNNIAPAMNKAARVYKDNFGWQIIGYPKGTMAVLNVPVQEGRTQHQYVMNTITGAWARFTGQNANCWEVFNDNLYFGGNDGNVYKADAGPNDNGADIVADMACAWNYFGDHGRLKRFTMIQPIITSDGLVAPSIALNTDFRETTPSGAGALSTTGSLLWDEFDWDEAYWPDDATTSSAWQSVAALGRCASVRIRIVANADSSNPILLQVNSFNLIMERGDFL
jgi:hypothetical protein